MMPLIQRLRAMAKCYRGSRVGELLVEAADALEQQEQFMDEWDERALLGTRWTLAEPVQVQPDPVAQGSLS